MVIVNVIILLVVSYLLGSFNTAYFLGKLSKGIDIRKYGSKNAGAMNASRVLGLGYSIFTASIDMLKAFIAVIIAYLIGMPDFMLLVVYVAVLAGHVFPFYLNWRGGYGVSASFGAAIGFIYPLRNNLELLVIYWFIVAIIYYSFRSFIIVPFREPSKVLIGKVKVWRKILRFIALIFPISYILFGGNAAFYLLIPIVTVFIIIDILRIWLPKTKKSPILKRIMKDKENKLSGISSLLIAILISFIFFSRDIAILITTMTIIGDNLAVLFGTRYGIAKLVGKKSLEGSVAFFASAFFAGLLLIGFKYVYFSFWFVLIAAFICTILELFSSKIKIDDNFLVQIGAGVIMTALSRLI